MGGPLAERQAARFHHMHSKSLPESAVWARSFESTVLSVERRLRQWGQSVRTSTSRRGPTLALAGLLLAAVVALEWWSQLQYSLGVLYVLPVMVAATVVGRREVVLAALGSAWVRSLFTPGLMPVEFWLRFTMAVLAYSGVGLLVVEISRHRRSVVTALGRLKLEQSMRQQAEAQLRDLADSSPAAILILNGRAEVLSANRAAHELLGFDTGTLVGQPLAEHVPLLTQALAVREAPTLRASTTGWARRHGGQHFPVSVWLSTYGAGEARRLACILADTSEEVRDRDRETFRHVYANNRLFASAVSHEIRNVCSAIRVVTSNLQRSALVGSPDLAALSTLVESLARIASFDLSSRRQVSPIEVESLLDQLRLVIEPDWADLDGELQWHLEPHLPKVQGDEYALLQVFLNLTQNSLRAVQESPERRLRIAARAETTTVRVSVEDSGPGVKSPSTLFQPFREGSSGAGLGLFISRNLARSVGGDLTWVRTERGCCFEVTLLRAAAAEDLAPTEQRA